MPLSKDNDNEEDTIEIPKVIETEVYTQPIETVIEKEIKMKEPSEAKLKISQEVRKSKFKFKKRGKLREDEMEELKKTNLNVFDWMAARKSPMATVVRLNELELALP